MESIRYSMSPNDIEYKIKKMILELRHIRVKRGLSQREIADIIGVRKGTICDMENFKYMPRMDLVFKYASALGYKVELTL